MVGVIAWNLLNRQILGRVVKKDIRKSHLKSSSDVLEALLGGGNPALSHQFTCFKLSRSWSEVVGASMAKNTLPVSYDKGTLVIWVSDSTWMQELSFAIDQIKEKINAHIGRAWVYNVRFTLEKKGLANMPAEA
jgi:hypothetical protein